MDKRLFKCLVPFVVVAILSMSCAERREPAPRLPVNADFVVGRAYKVNRSEGFVLVNIDEMPGADEFSSPFCRLVFKKNMSRVALVFVERENVDTVGGNWLKLKQGCWPVQVSK